MHPTDINGHRLQVGVPVAFATRVGNSHELRVGKVTGFTADRIDRPVVLIMTDRDREIDRPAGEVARTYERGIG